MDQKFRGFVLESDKGMDLVAYLLCYGLEIKDKPGEWSGAVHESITNGHAEQHGLCRAVSYIVQSLSAERAFGAKLASPIKAQLPPKISTLGNAGDFLISVSVIVRGSRSSSPNLIRPSIQ